MARLCFCCSSTPWLPVADLLPYATGFDGVELAVKPHRYDPGLPADFWRNNAALIDTTGLEAALPALGDALAMHRLPCALLSSYHDAGEVAVQRRLAAAARSLGGTLIRATVPAPAAGAAAFADQLATLRRDWRELAAIGAGEGVRFVLELHDHTATPSASAGLRLIEGLDPTAVGVIWDVANTCYEGNEVPALVLAILGPYLAHIHVKQRRYRTIDIPSPRHTRLAMDIVPVVEPGDVPWGAIGPLIVTSGYEGWWSVEDFTRLDTGPARLAADCAWARATLP